MKLYKRTEAISIRVCPELLELVDLINSRDKYSLSDIIHKAVAKKARTELPFHDFEKYRSLIEEIEQTDGKKERRQADLFRKKQERKNLINKLF